MAPWHILIVALALVGLAAALAAWRVRRQRSNRLHLRLLAGRRRLLGEEIDSRQQRLAGIDADELSAQQHEAGGLLDGLHVALLDREAHLQSLQELAHLQQHKLKILNRHRSQALAATASMDSTAAQPGPAASSPTGNVIESRDDLEDQFLQALQKRDDAPRPRPRRR